ncbi:MAG: hypothetical protein IKX86_06280 [Clostridia bacterium]|nr:hypothetical protein [Clostridia bacterium]
MMGKTEFETFLSTGKFADNSTKTAIVPFSEGGYAKYLSENGKWTFTGFKHPSGDGQPETESAEYFENLLDKSGLTDYSDVRVIDVPVYGARFLSVNCGGEPRLIAVSGGEDAGFESGALYTCSECEDIIRTYDFGDGLSDGSAAPARTWVPVVLISGAALIGLALFAVLTYKLKEKRPR